MTQYQVWRRAAKYMHSHTATNHLLKKVLSKKYFINYEFINY